MHTLLTPVRAMVRKDTAAADAAAAPLARSSPPLDDDPLVGGDCNLLVNRGSKNRG